MGVGKPVKASGSQLNVVPPPVRSVAQIESCDLDGR